jgi:lipopolysaccharide transport system ATP-binding protein
MLELGMGFHPDFTGRQNVYMAAQLLGMNAAEIDEAMPGIEAFAEIGEYIDSPVRVYSSGMQMRLAFSVATARRPDILIVDEALSVGDAYFQHKSFARIRDFRQQGTTLLIVSHDKQAIQSLCDSAILLDGGRIAYEGEPEAVMDYYNALIADRENNAIEAHGREDGRIEIRSGTGEARVVDIKLKDANSGAPLEVVGVGQDVVLDVKVAVDRPIPRLIFGFMIKDRLGQPVYGTNTDLFNQPIELADAGDEYRFQISFRMNVGTGPYSIATALCSTNTHLVNNYEWRDLALVFSVLNMNRKDFIGFAWLEPTFLIEKT